MNRVLELTDVETGYGEVQVLWGVTLAVEERKMTTLVGANGAGKTTTMRAIMGVVKPWRGSVRFLGEDVTQLTPHEKAQLGLVLVPEGRQLFADLSVAENLEMGAYSPRARKKLDANFKKVYELFPRLLERKKQKAGTLSGGEQQMLAVGRGLMADPVVLMIDELSLGLAPVLAQSLFGTLKRLKDEGLTILLVEQNVHLALALSDYAYVLAEGRVKIEGPSRQVARNEEVREAYLGV
ncbi:ABC transporter ATP-binding protein [Oceanithermus sp.]|uniref:ABC transporter ATP-binding protein n=1 Tax=Oceanithermus sp. TaxID=2268145 RepID=UPI0025FA7D82|nr:ABC transporter ATP-binding protein [Oceanithermus sp.]